MLNVGIIGAGFFGERHAEAIAAVDGVRLVAASRTDPAALGAFVRRFGGQGYLDNQKLLADPAVDAVVIATPHHLHTTGVFAAAKARKHILLEKPMAPTLDECDQIIRAAADANVKLMAGHTSHFFPAYQFAKELIVSGEMGEVVLGSSTMSKFWFEPNRQPWHLDRATGGGMWMTAGMHCLDRLTWLVDSPIQTVTAQFDTRFHEQRADDVGMIFLRYANGAAGTVISTGYHTGAPKHVTELTCTKGMLNISAQGVTVGRDEQWQLINESVGSDQAAAALENEWRAFLEAVETDGQPAVTGDFARHIMAAVFAAQESSRLQQEIIMP
jgi:phthalate 4,5-cis-dihydrodiol dehydrogenase